MTRAANKAVIRVTYPDGCRQEWETRTDCDIARDSVKFAAWLKEIADAIEETATAEGLCAAPDRPAGEKT